MKIIPKKAKITLEIFAGITVIDLVIITAAIALCVLIFGANVLFALKAFFIVFILLSCIFALIKFEDRKGYKMLGSMIRHLCANKNFVKRAKAISKSVEAFCPFTEVINDKLHYRNGDYSIVFEIEPNNFLFYSEIEQEVMLTRLGEAYKSIPCHSIVKMEKPLDLSAQIHNMNALKNSFENTSPEKLESVSRSYVLAQNLEYFTKIEQEKRLYKDAFYLVVYGNEHIDQLEEAIINDTANARLSCARVRGAELARFVSACYGCDNDDVPDNESDYIAASLPDTLSFSAKTVSVNGKQLFTYTIRDYPVIVDNCWAYALLSIPQSRVAIHASLVPQSRAIKMLDNALQELRRRVGESSQEKDSKQNALVEQLATLQLLLENVQLGNEALHNITVIVQAEAAIDKELYLQFKRNGFSLANLTFLQQQGYFSFLPCRSALLGDYSRDINTVSYAAAYPFVSNALMDEKGIFIGEDLQGFPVFFDIDYHSNRASVTANDVASSRNNGNMFVVGSTGAGKSYFIKRCILDWVAQGDKVVLLDPEAEYLKIAALFGGSIIDVAGGKRNERINPFHVFPPLEDDENSQVQGTLLADVEKMYEYMGQSFNKKHFNYSFGSYDQSPLSTHRVFLDKFFRLAIPNLDDDGALKLSSLVGLLYTKKGITDDSYFDKLKATDFPIMQELHELIMSALKKEKDEYEKRLLHKLAVYIEAFGSKGVFGKLWNGHTTLDFDGNIIDLNFRGLFANKNNNVANAQMLLILRYLENIIIKNRDANSLHGLDKHVRIIIDESHLFIDEKTLAMLDFLSQIGKRIRKYKSSIIPATQNFKDYLGRTGDTNAKASAVINACQYKAVFPLAADDITALVQLYQSSTPITDAENSVIRNLTRGQCLFMVTDKKRMRVDITVLDGDKHFMEAI